MIKGNRKTKLPRSKVKVISSYRQTYFSGLEVAILLEEFFLKIKNSDHSYSTSYYSLPVI